MSEHHHHNHERGHHNHAINSSEVKKALWFALILNLSFLVVELVVGLITNSLALLSDAGHMVSDVAALALAIFVQHLATKNPGGSYTYGLKRAPVIGAFGNAITLLLIVFVIFWEAVQRLLDPPEIPGMPILVVGILGLIVNVLSGWWLHRNSDDSHNVKGAILHMFADALGSVGAILAAVILMTTGWTLIDPIISFIIGGLILFSTWPLLKDTTKVLLEAAPDHLNIEDITDFLLHDNNVAEIIDFHIWEIDSGKLALSAIFQTKINHIADLQGISDAFRKVLFDKFGIYHCTFEWRNSPGQIKGCG